MTELLIVGTTGLVGRAVLRRASADPRITRVVAPTRKPLPRPMPPKLENPVVDFEELPGDARWWEVDAVICTLGTTLKQAGSRGAFRRVDFDYVLAAAECAQRHGAIAFALNSSLGADATSGNFYLRTKGEVEGALRRLGYLSLTIVRPSVIAGERGPHGGSRPMERLSLNLLGIFGRLVPVKYRPVAAEVIASALIEAAVAASPGARVIESEDLQPGRRGA
jgi:uncharacterized protein YbjT (DUF2867 family)